MTSTVQPYESAAALEENLSRPWDRTLELFRRIDGDLMLLGVAGKMGPTLARMARRACDAIGSPRRIYGVSRFQNPGVRTELEAWGIETIACDLLDEAAVARLPRTPWVIAMPGMKFGTQSQPANSWAMNCYLPAIVARHFRQSRLVVFSSGNVYGLVPVQSGGSRETDELRPVGEYAMTVLGRERMFEYFSRLQEMPVALLRLNYATELRYGVLVDLALKVWREDTIDLSMGYVNVIWQGDANAMALQALEQTDSPPRPLNLAGPDILRVRDVCERFAARLDKRPKFAGKESDEALLNNATASYELLGRPQVSVDEIIEWTATWVRRGGKLLGKPTHFESRDGRF